MEREREERERWSSTEGKMVWRERGGGGRERERNKQSKYLGVLRPVNLCGYIRENNKQREGGERDSQRCH